MSRTVKIAATVLVLIGGAGLLVYAAVADSQRSQTVDKVVLQPEKYTDGIVRLHGYVEPGSIQETIVDQSTRRTFVLHENGKTIRVRHDGPKPDTFRDRAEVVAKGRLLKDADGYVFEASELMAKCPSKYKGKPNLHKNYPPSAEGGKPIF